MNPPTNTPTTGSPLQGNTPLRRRAGMAIMWAVCSAGVVPMLAWAQPGYPSKPVTLIVGFPAGSETDMVARVMADRLSKRLGQPFIVDNRPGESGSVAAGLAARAKPDGYTLLLSGSSSQAIIPHLHANLPYDAKKDFTPVGQISWLPYVLAVKQNSPYQTLEQLIESARQSPEALTYASTGMGSGSNMAMSALLSQAGVQMTHIPYTFKGSEQIQLDIIGGEIDTTFDTVVSTQAKMKAGKMRALAISSAARSAIAPDVPTVAEQGYPDFNLGVWLGLLGPSRLPADIQQTLAREINVVLQEPATRQKLQELGSEPRMTASPEKFAALIGHDGQQWGALIRHLNINAE